MKATKEFFESLRSEAQNEVITSATDMSKVSAENTCTPVSNLKSGIAELFSACGCIDVNDATFTKAVTIVEAQYNTYESEIESLKAEIRTLNAEKEAAESELDKQRNEAEAQELGLSKEELDRRMAIPIEVLNKWYEEDEAEMNNAETDGDECHNELIQQIEEGKQRESELRAALDDERKRHEAADGIERLPASVFIDYAEKHYPADQNKSAKILKEAIFDLYDRKRISDEDYERCKLLGTKEPPTASVLKELTAHPSMNDNNGIVAGGNFNANIGLTDNQFDKLADNLAKNGKLNLLK